MSETRVALVTGGSRGIGAAIAQRLAADGIDVALTYERSAERAAETVRRVTAEGRRGLAVQADSADAEAVVAAVERTVTELGRIDVLVNNAGIFPMVTLEELTVAEIDRTLAIHVRAVILAAQAAARHMTEGGRIITIGSNLAERVPAPGLSLYAASKAAVLGLTRGLARDLGGRGITSVVVSPGSTDTEMNPADGPHADGERSAIAVGRYNDPSDIAGMVAYLAGDGGRHVTGTAITVDGGASA
ncbi:NAD(P)-dependent dehydrogenase (short-subunit alcohol dehydrogenase family) [Actinoalloteichus hoggarensis]|uniref:Cyclic-di-GMP-binding biofilm dispersal mediator protein n=1 Tax=Actinoalloteichus hoggarensis TaxID=1470176 RepID=A0A221W614_9PSEU|nr:SDR family oxidoreductase [Actinoalloteichus hoggarensis]ASO21134.1 Cyclic-di-GMP-binding biofilm dispersal mediator protein [Actinoalloteichus hoggarensis]MBB5921063.1 NAD(P)-dependent dehydrogenase (short-subunit alcohol dehydrogenase family) [Actinoalloteichus hoggarensis]